MSPSAIQVDKIVHILQWKAKGKAAKPLDEGSSQVVLEILANGDNLHALESKLHVPSARILQAILEYAVQQATKADTNSADAIQMLSQAMIQTKTYQLSLQSCSQLLNSLAKLLQQHAQDKNSQVDETLIASAASIFVRLFENNSTDDFAPRFGVFKPPTDVYATFFQEIVPALLEISSKQPSKAILRLVLAIIDVYHALQKNQTNKKKVFLATKQALPAFIPIRAAMCAQLPYASPLVDALDTMIADALFDNEHIHGYSGLVMASQQWPAPPSASDASANESKPPSKKAKGKDGNAGKPTVLKSYQHQLFQEIQSLLGQVPHVAEFMEMLVNQYVTYIRRVQESSTELVDSKKRKASHDAMTPGFCFWLDMCGIALSKRESIDIVALMHTWHCLWQSMNAKDIYRVAEDNSAQHQLYYLERVVESVLALVLPTSPLDSVQDEAKLLTDMVQCSPKILQPHLGHVFKYLSGRCVASSTALEASAQCFARLVALYDAMRLLQDFLDVLFRLDGSGTMTAVVHHKDVDNAVREAFAHMPVGQIEALWLFFHDALYTTTKNVQDRMQLVRIVFGLFVQEVPVAQHMQPTLHKCAKQTFDLVLVPAIENKTVEDAQRQALSLLGDLLELGDKGVDTSFVLSGTFDSNDNFLNKLESLCTSKKSSGHEGILKLAATQVRNLRANFQDEKALPLADFVLRRATELVSFAAITPFLSELGYCASPDVCAAFVQALTTAAVAKTLVPNVFLDAGLYEIRPFLQSLPQVFTTVLVERAKPLFASKSATLSKFKHSKFTNDAQGIQALHEAVTFMSAVPIPFLVGQSRDDLVCTMLELEQLLVQVDKSTVADIVDSLHKWLITFLSTISSPLPATVFQQVESWTLACLARPAPAIDAALVKAFVRVLVQFHVKAMKPINDAIVARTTKGKFEPITLQLVASTVDSYATSTHAHSEQFFRAVLPPVLDAIDKASDPVSLTAVFASLLRFDHTHGKSRGPTSELLERLGRVLASACRTLTNDEPQDGAVKLLQVVAQQYRELATHSNLQLDTFGRILASMLVGISRSPSLAKPLNLLLERVTDEEFRLVWQTLNEEITRHEDSARVLGGLRGMLCVLRLEKVTPFKRTLQDTSKVLLGHLVDLCSATSKPDQIQVVALEVIVQAFTRSEAFAWHASDVQLALLALRPLESLTSGGAVGTDLSEPLVHEAWQQSYMLLLRQLRQYHTSLAVYLPHFVSGCNALLRAMLQLAAVKGDHVKTLHLWASNLTRLYGYMIPHSATFRKHMVYMLAEFFNNHKNDTLPHDVLQTLRPGIYALFDICSKYEKEQLYGTLDSTGKILLKAMDAHYKETHQYTGKV